jgi:hypothetical protein
VSRNEEFFHGSNHPFEVGDLVDPSFDSWGGGEAHATNDHMIASTYGDNVYQVEPIGHLKKISSDNATVHHYTSHDGFRVKGIVH